MDKKTISSSIKGHFAFPFFILLMISNVCYSQTGSQTTVSGDLIFPGYVGGAVGGAIGYKILGDVDFIFMYDWLEEGNNQALFWGALCGSLASTGTVYTVGNKFMHGNGSLLYTSAGGMGGVLVALALWTAGALVPMDEYLIDGLATGSLVIGTLLSPIFATAGYKMSPIIPSRGEDEPLFMRKPMVHLQDIHYHRQTGCILRLVEIRF